MFSAAARIRRRSGLPLRVIATWSWSCCSVVYAWIVVMKPSSIPKLSRSSFRHRPDRVRRARRVGNDVVLVLVVFVVVHAHHERDVGVGRGSGDEHLLRPRLKMLLGAVSGGEEARRLDDDVDTEVSPRQRSRITLGEHLERGPADADLVALLFDTFKSAVRRVVAEKVRENVRRGEIVDGDEIERAARST
jgi:hypothetical protein